jgi:hypothetical protein
MDQEAVMLMEFILSSLRIAIITDLFGFWRIGGDIITVSTT